MIKRLFVFVLLIAGVVAFFFFRTVYQARQARFNVDALDRYIHAYEQLSGKTIKSFADLPEFHLVSQSEGLQLSDQDIKKGIYEGYVYDLRGGGTEDYVLSASPVGFMAPHMEFAALRDGSFYMNRENPDVDADTAEEVKGWSQIMRAVSVKTRDVPDYMKM